MAFSQEQCLAIYALVTGEGLQPDMTQVATMVVRKLSRGQRELLQQQGRCNEEEVLGEFQLYILEDPAILDMVRRQPGPGINLAWPQFVPRLFEKSVEKKLYERLGKLGGQIDFAAGGGPDEDDVESAIRERVHFVYGNRPQHRETYVSIPLTLYGPESRKEDPLFRDPDLIRIAELVREELGPVTLVALANGISKALPRGIWFPPRHEHQSLDALLEEHSTSSEKGGKRGALGTAGGYESHPPVDVEAEALSKRIWNALEPPERFVLTGRFGKMTGRKIMAWCEEYNVQPAFSDEKRLSEAVKGVKEKLKSIREESGDFELFAQALQCLLDGPMQELLDANPPDAG